MSKYNLVLNENTPSINNINNVTLTELSGVVSGTAENILCEVLDGLTYDERLKAIGLMIKKLSFGGEITIKFINTYKLCKDLIRGDINSKSWSEIVENSKSMVVESDILEIVSKTDQIKINKIYNSNNHIIVVLKKTNEQ